VIYLVVIGEGTSVTAAFHRLMLGLLRKSKNTFLTCFCHAYNELFLTFHKKLKGLVERRTLSVEMYLFWQCFPVLNRNSPYS